MKSAGIDRGCRRVRGRVVGGWALLFSAAVLAPVPALALQVHPAPEGLYAHQIAHGFFALAMTMVAFWLQRRRLVRIQGWRFIQVACLFLVAWNLAAMTGHWVENRMADPEGVRDLGSALAAAYYGLKMDHLFCVPAMAFLYVGLRRLRSAGGDKT